MSILSKFILFFVLLVFSNSILAQQTSVSLFDIPVSHQKHPEIHTHKHTDNLNEVDYELVHLRTEHSRTFSNKNKTKTTVQSSIPLHYLNENGYWVSLDYKIENLGQKLVYPNNYPNIEFDKTNLTTLLKEGEAFIRYGKESKLTYFIANQQQQNFSVDKSKKPQISSNQNALTIEDYFEGIDWKNSFYFGAFKNDFVLKKRTSLPNQLEKLSFQELIELPEGFRLEYEMKDGIKTNRLIVVDRNDLPHFTFEKPIVTDAKTYNLKNAHLRQHHEGTYIIEYLAPQLYKVHITVDGDWLLAEDRVYPVTIDPVVTVTNNDVINSCFLPTYQQASLNVAVPVGETVLSSEISYDFIAVNGTNAWMSDQYSFVEGPNGQTPIQQGQGNTAGTYAYQITNSPIGNTLSTGQVEFTFNFARDWGGSGCNNTFNFVNRREVTVTYGTITYGDGPIYINEYSASNRSFSDGFGRTEDWIELYNSNPTDFFDLTGYHLSNDNNNPTMWQIQDGLIPPASRIIVYCSKRDISSGVVQHANFNLTQLRPDRIVLADPSGTVMEDLEMFVTQTNHSYGRLTDGGTEWGVFNSPTPGQQNANGFIGYTSKPTFDVAPGNYAETVTLTLNSSDIDEVIRYTTNGSTPTPSSTLYTTPITVSSTTVIRARSFSSNAEILPGFIETNTYLINENHTLPVFSFAGDADIMALFNGNNTLRPRGNFEYFERNGEFIDENFGDFDKHGNDSWNYAQRGVDFVSRDDHGYNRRLEHQFFATSDRTRFRRLMVKAAANDNFPHQTGGAHIRDSYIMTLSQLAGLDLDERSSTNVVLYLNGQYWGVYDLRERVDDNNYTDYYFNQDYKYRESDEYLQFLKTWGGTQAHFGNQPAINDWASLTQYVQNNNMGDAANFDYVNSQLNIKSMIDYFVINSFVVSRDWLNYNTGWWRGTNPMGDAQKWRYILWDMEAALGHFHNYTGLANTSATAPPCQAENLNVGQGHTQTLRKLIQENPAVRQMYVTRYADLLNTHLSCERIIEVLDSMVAVIEPEMPRQISRWGGNISTWENNVQAVRTFLTARCEHLMNTGLGACYDLTGPFATTFDVQPAGAGRIKMNSEWLPSYPFNAQVFGNIDTHLESEEYPGFTFSHWVVDGAVINPDPTDPLITLELSQATTVTAVYTENPTGTGDLIYYWHFNTLETPEDVTSIPADYQLIEDVFPLMRYIGSGPRDIDANNNGSELNLHQDEDAGRCARVRNPSENRALVFDLPTTGYRDIYFDYAVERTNQGQLINQIAYSIDGINFITTGLSQDEFNISTSFELISIDFTEISGVNHNPDFKIRISFEGNNATSNGNNRFDNITLKGLPILDLSTSELASTQLQLFPNPFTSEVSIIHSETISHISVYDMLGKMVFNETDIDAVKTAIDLSSIKPGVYTIVIHTLTEDLKARIIKQ